MIAPSRATLMKVHAGLAAFLLPIGLMFLVTGGLYTAGIKGESAKESFDVQRSQPIRPGKATYLDLARTELDQREIAYPTGKIRYGDKRGRRELRWNGLNRSVRVRSTSDPRIVTMTIKTPDWFSRTMRLHKADGKAPFKVYAITWTAMLLTLFLSGVAIAWRVAHLRRIVVGFGLLGILTFFALLSHSVWHG